jgi:hypothetical protein
MTQPGGPSQVPSPFPAGTTGTVIWVDAEGKVLPSQEGAAGGEITVTFPGGRVEHVIFTSVG